MMPQGNAPTMGGINPQMLTQMMPHLLTFAAGAGFKELVSNFEKISKLMGAGQSEKAQQPGGPQGAAPSGAPVPSAAPAQDPNQFMMLMQLLKARMAAQGGVA